MIKTFGSRVGSKAVKLSVVLALLVGGVFVFAGMAHAATANITQLVITSTGPQTISAGDVSAKITVTTENASNNPEKLDTSGTVITLTSSSTTGQFSSNAVTWNPVTSLTMASGTATRSFYYKDSTAGTFTITVSSGSWASATQSITVNPAPCSTGIGSPLVVDATQQISNDPDSSVPGPNWALDNFSRHIQIWQEGSHYCAEADDNGTFTTNGTISPQSGTSLPQTVTGTIVGGTHGEIATTTIADVGAWGNNPPSIDCNATSTCASGLTHFWVSNYFPGETYQYDNGWGWVYTTPFGEQWVNASDGNSGDIHAVYDVTSGIGYPTIQAAVTAASAGDTIDVGAGTYNETVNINKALTIDGANSGTAGNGTRGSESIVNAFNISTSSVIINGFSLATAGSQVSINSTPILSGVVVENNIFDGYSSVGMPTNNAGNILVQNNLFKNPAGGSEAMQIKANVLSGCNGSQVMNNVFTAATNNGGADVNFSCTDSTSTNVTVSGNTSTGNSNSSSFTAFSGVDDGISVTGNTATTNGSAIFFFGNVSGSVAISGNAITSGGSYAISIHGGDHLGTDDTSNSGTFTITNNNLSGNVRGISVAAGALNGGNVVAHNNNLSGNSAWDAFNGDTTTTVDVTSNWWGSVNPNFGTITSGNLNYTPWCADSACNVTISATTTASSGTLANTTLGLSGTASSTDGAIVLGTSTATFGGNTATFPDGTEITGTPSPFNLDDFTTQTTYGPTNVNDLNQIVVVQLGIPGTTLNFSQPVTVSISVGSLVSDGATLYIFLSEDGSTWSMTGLVNTTCMVSGGVCTFQTNQASLFAVQTYPGPRITGGGGGGGGGGGTVPAAPAVLGVSTTTSATSSVPTAPTVLGTAAVNFSVNLRLGMKNSDVANLQQILKDQGFFHIAPTGYFGPVTLAAVKEYQKAHNVPATGFVGNLTRAALNGNSGAVAGASIDVQAIQAQISALQARVQQLMDELKAMQGQ